MPQEQSSQQHRDLRPAIDAAVLSAGAIAAAGVIAAAALFQRKPRPAKAAPPAASPGRGKHARTPTEIPAQGWKEILMRVYAEISDDRLLAVAAGVTFYGLLAIFPAIVALVSLYGLVADLSTLNDQLASFEGVVPGGALDIARDQVTRIVTKSDGSLGFAFLFGLAAALWSANAGMKALFDALNVVYDEHERRSFFRLNLMSLTFTAGAIVFLLLAFNAIVVLPITLDFVGLGDRTETLLSLGRWPLLFCVVMLGLTLLYRFGPSRAQPKWRWAAPGSLIAALIWIAASAGFSWYAANMATYNETYGSLGAVIGFMTWIWISVIVVLLGGELNAEMEHQTAADTTTGSPLPLGLRGARMADTVAP